MSPSFLSADSQRGTVTLTITHEGNGSYIVLLVDTLKDYSSKDPVLCVFYAKSNEYLHARLCSIAANRQQCPKPAVSSNNYPLEFKSMLILYLPIFTSVSEHFVFDPCQVERSFIVYCHCLNWYWVLLYQACTV